MANVNQVNPIPQGYSTVVAYISVNPIPRWVLPPLQRLGIAPR